jgi:hypothetical protein
MAFHFSCSGCGVTLSTSARKADKVVTCPRCCCQVYVPEPLSMIPQDPRTEEISDTPIMAPEDSATMVSMESHSEEIPRPGHGRATTGLLAVSIVLLLCLGVALIVYFVSSNERGKRLVAENAQPSRGATSSQIAHSVSEDRAAGKKAMRQEEYKEPLVEERKAEQARFLEEQIRQKREGERKSEELNVQQEQGKEQRKKRLAELAQQERSVKNQMNDQVNKRTIDLNRLKKRLAEVDRVRFQFVSGTPASQQMQAEFSELKRRGQIIEQQIAAEKEKTQKTLDEIEQQKRKTIVEFPLPADEEYFTHKDRLYTRAEILELTTLAQEHGTPQVAADTYMKTLLGNGTIEGAAFVRVEMLSERHIRLDRRYWRVVVYRARYVSKGGFVNDREMGVLVRDAGNGYWFVAPEVKLTGPVALPR